MGPEAWGYIGTAVERGCPGPMASFLVVTENYQKTPKQLYLYIYTLYFKYVISRKWVWNIWRLVVVFRLAFNRLLVMGESFPHTYMQRASRLPVSGPHHLCSGGNQRGWRDGRRVLTAVVQPTLSTDDTDWKFWFSSPADIAQRVDSQAQLWEDNSLFIRRCQESWGASRQWEPLADATVGPQVHHSY